MLAVLCWRGLVDLARIQAETASAVRVANERVTASNEKLVTVTERYRIELEALRTETSKHDAGLKTLYEWKQSNSRLVNR
jgi:hypothetical protein